MQAKLQKKKKKKKRCWTIVFLFISRTISDRKTPIILPRVADRLRAECPSRTSSAPGKVATWRIGVRVHHSPSAKKLVPVSDIIYWWSGNSTERSCPGRLGYKKQPGPMFDGSTEMTVALGVAVFWPFFFQIKHEFGTSKAEDGKKHAVGLRFKFRNQGWLEPQSWHLCIGEVNPASALSPSLARSFPSSCGKRINSKR